jgi:hypothetical protein
MFADDWMVRGLTVAEMMRRHGFRSKVGLEKTLRRLGLPKRPGGRPPGTGVALRGGRWERRGMTRVWVEEGT